MSFFNRGNQPRLAIDSAEELEKTFHQLIPISKSMGVTVVDYTENSLTLGAPLLENINHQNSAFGGSLFSLSALTGWGILQIQLSRLSLDCNTVVANATVNYSRPVFDDLRCTVELTENKQKRFEELLETVSQVIDLDARIESRGEIAMTSTATYHIKVRQADRP